MERYITEFIHEIADWLEAIGFLATIITAVKVFFLNKQLQHLHQKHLYQVRIAEHLEDLKKSSKIISMNLSEFPVNLREIKVEFGQCIEHFKSLKKKVPSKEFKSLNPIMNKMRWVINNKIRIGTKPNFLFQIIGYRAITEEDIDDIYYDITSIITEINHYNNDLKKALK